MENSNTYKFGGREWRGIQVSTLRRRNYYFRNLREAGIDYLPASDETGDDFARRIGRALIESGVTPELIGALVMPMDIPDEKWTLEIAAETAEIAANLTDEDHPEIDRILLGELAFQVFMNGLRFLKPTLIVSAPEETVQPEMNDKRDANLVSATLASSAT